MTGRIILFARDSTPLGDLDPTTIRSAKVVEELNGEHSLTIETTTVLEEGTRILAKNVEGEWQEYCVTKPDQLHASGDVAVGTYMCPWSLYVDLVGADGSERWASAARDALEPITAREALAIALTDQSRWIVGTVDVDTMSACTLYDAQVWDYLCEIVETFGGEVSTTIAIPNGTKITARKVNLLAHLGSTEAKRRFDWGYDLTSIHRIPAEGPYVCGIRPRGGQVKTDADGVDYSDRVDITDEPSASDPVDPDGWYHVYGTPYIYDHEAEMAFRIMNSNGVWEYPMQVVTYDVVETSSGPDAEELMAKAVKDVYSYTRPKVTYEADVLAFANAGMDIVGIALGDETQCVDRGFSETAALRIEGRIVRREYDLMQPETTMSLTLGNLAPTMGETIRGIAKGTLATVERRVSVVEGEAARFRNIDTDMLVADMAKIETLYVAGLDVDEAIINKLSAKYAQIDAANINTATIREAWVDHLLVQTGLIAHEGTVFTLDAVQVNAANITAGTLDVERLVVTVNGHKYMVHVDPSTGTPSYEKLHGDVIEDLTITADKIVSHTITAEKITTENIVGSGGWINLHLGRFAYVNAETGDGIVWDGSHLYISGSVTVGGDDVAISAIAEMAKNAERDASEAKQTADDVPIIGLQSTAGMVFKRNLGISTTITATIFTPGGNITNKSELTERFGAGAYLEWGWRDVKTGVEHVILSTDPRILNDGFAFIVSPSDVDTQAVITCSLNY